MKHVSFASVGLLVVLAGLAAGCARRVTLEPELLPQRNDPDWIVRSAPSAAIAPRPN